MSESNKYKFLFAGGGTGGHLFPALAVAEKIRKMKPESEILFIGTKGKIEEKIVPQLGFEFKKIWITGFSRKMNLKILIFPLKLFVSVIQSLLINMKFKPKIAVGSGGYVAGPAIWSASVCGSKVLLIEPNSYPGVTTKLLEKYADEIYINFEETKKYLKEKEKLFLSGAPVREGLKLVDKKSSLEHFDLNEEKKTLLILGGSLGARSINNAASKFLNEFLRNEIQVIWQTGKLYFDEYKHLKTKGVWINSFIEKMEYAYSASDLVVCRAGASTVSELALLQIPSILVPSPNVTDDHQFYNARSLSNKNGASILEDGLIEKDLLSKVLSLIKSDSKLKEMKDNLRLLSKKNAAELIAKRAIEYAESE